MIYQLETITEDWYKEFEEAQKFIRFDHFWRKIDDLKDVMGEKKIPINYEDCVDSPYSWT